MSATASAPSFRPGWPPEAGDGFCQAPHYMLRRIWRVCGRAVEVGCCQLIMDETIGWNRRWTVLAKGWFARELNVTESAVEQALSTLRKRGLIESKPSDGGINQYRVNLEAFDSGPEYQAPKPEAVDNEAKSSEAPRARPVEEAGVTYYGKALKRFHAGPLLVADKNGAATVALCGDCQTVGIFEMIGAPKLQFVEQKAKVRPISSNSTDRGDPERSQGGPKRRRHPPPRAAVAKAGGRAAASAPAIQQTERVQAMQRYLSTWKPVLGYAPSMGKAAEIDTLLGDCPLELFIVRCSRRRDYLLKAKSFNAFKPLANDCGESYVAEVGEACPECGKSVLKTGEICSFCGPAIEVTPRPEHPDWDPIRAALRERLTPQSWRNWIEHTWGIPSENGALRVGVHDDATADWLREEYRDLILEVVAQIHGERFKDIEYVVE